MVNSNSLWLSRMLAREDELKQSNLKIRTLHEDEEPEDDEIYYEGSAIKVPLDIDPSRVFIHKELSDEQLKIVVDGIQKPEENFQKNEVPDDILHGDDDYFYIDTVGMNTKSTYKKDKFGRRMYPDGWEIAYYPAGKRGLRGKQYGKKPHIDAIKMWVRDTKLAGMSQMQLEDEYRRVRGSEGNVSWNSDKMDSLVDSIAYIVARKIWYVGRKSSRENDETWDELTRDMRPPQGSFDSNENWGESGFPYGEEYTYSSGDK